MPLPKDRESLLRLAAETEGAIEETATRHNSQVALRHAAALLKLGRIRLQLGELREADRLFRHGESAAWALNSQTGRELAATAKVLQAALAGKEGNNKEALAIFDRIVTQFGGMPTFETLPMSQAALFGVWLGLLDDAKQYERLYEATDMAIAALDPSQSPEERITVGQAYARRARSAEHLGHKQDAIELYEKAIVILEAEKEGDEMTTWLLDRAVTSVPSLLSDLHRDADAAIAYQRSLTRLRSNKTLWARINVFAAKLWLKVDKL
jgi:tetratricopeptide (TPR) repeat protein